MRPTRMNGWRGSWQLLLALALALGLFSGGLPLAEVARAATYTCDEAGLDAAVMTGGEVAFDCAAATTITITSTKTITKDTIIDGGGLLTISGGYDMNTGTGTDTARQVFKVSAGVKATLRNLTIIGGKSSSGTINYIESEAAGIQNAGELRVEQSNVSYHWGAGIGNTGILTVVNSTLLTNGHSASAGSILNRESGTVIVTGSYIAESNAGDGSGIYTTGPGTVSVTNSTFYYHFSTREGGAFYNNGSAITVTNSTFKSSFAGNTTSSFVSGYGGTMTLRNVILDGGNCLLQGGATFIDGGGNISRQSSCSLTEASSQANTNPQTANFPLNNGGPTKSYLALSVANSAIINRGVAANCPATDQRGIARPLGANCTIGAVEGTTATPDPTLTGLTSSPDAVVAGAGGTVTLTLTGANFLPGITAVRIKSAAATSGATTANGGSIAVTVTSPTTLTATFPAFALGTAGDYEVTVTDAPLETTNSSALTLTVLATAPTPTPTPSPTSTPSPTPSPSTSPTPSSTPTPSPSTTPSPTPSTVTVTASIGGGNGTVTPAGSATYATGSVATYTAIPAGGQVFLGWTLDGEPVGYASPLDFTVNTDRVLIARFAPEPTFGDVPRDDPAAPAVAELTARGIILGYADGSFGPADPLLRAQAAALLTRALGWSGEIPANTAPFTDIGEVDPELQRAVAILAQREIAQGYGDGTYGPADKVTHAQAISLIARSMVRAGYWVAVTPAEDDGTAYPNVTASSGHRYDLLTFAKYAGAILDRPANQHWADWEAAADRAWMAQTLWQAYSAVFGVDRIP